MKISGVNLRFFFYLYVEYGHMEDIRDMTKANLGKQT